MTIAPEALGPAITFVAWLVVILVLRRRAQIAISEWLAVLGGVVMVQLLLDLLRRGLGDLAIAVLHGVGAVVLALRKRNARRAAKPGARNRTGGSEVTRPNPSPRAPRAPS